MTSSGSETLQYKIIHDGEKNRSGQTENSSSETDMDLCETSLQCLPEAMEGQIKTRVDNNLKSNADTMKTEVYCKCDAKRLVEFVCEDHTEAFCTECKGARHIKCKISSIKERSKTFSTNTLKLTSDKISNIISKVSNLQKQHQESVTALSHMEDDCKTQIRAMREKLHAYVDSISDASMLELKSCVLTRSQHLDNVSTTIETVKEQLENEMNHLLNALSSNNVPQMLIRNMMAKEKCYEFERKTTEIENDTKLFELSFDEERSIAKMIEKINKLGTILVKTQNIVQTVVPKGLKSMTVAEEDSSRFTPKDAERMTGSTFMPNGDLLVCDRYAQTVKLFDRNFREVSKLQLPSNPWDVALVKKTTALISMPYVMKLQFVGTKNGVKFQSKRCFILDKKCFGLAVEDDKIFVSCSDAPGNGEIRILDLAGTVKRRIGINQDGTTQLINPLYILLMSKSNDAVIASEYGKREIVCITKDGKIQFKCRIPGSQSLRGMIIDKDENIYVCDESKNCIYVITESGTKHDIFLEINPADGTKPTSVCYRASDDTLIVICWKTILVYKLKPK